MAAGRGGEVDCERALESTAFDWEVGDVGWVVRGVVGVDPGLGSGGAVFCDDEEDVFGPKGPPWCGCKLESRSTGVQVGGGLLLKYRANVRTSATPLWLSTPSMFLHAAINTMASVASALGP